MINDIKNWTELSRGYYRYVVAAKVAYEIMSETLKTQLIYEIAEELIKKFDVDVSKEILNIINKHLYNYDVIKKQTSLIVLDTTSEKLLKMYLGTKR